MFRCLLLLCLLLSALGWAKEIDPYADTPTAPPWNIPYEPEPTPVPGVPGDYPSQWDNIPEFEPNGWNCYESEYGQWHSNPWCL